MRRESTTGFADGRFDERPHAQDGVADEGFVETIGWRSTRLRTNKNNIVIVPNQKLSQAILTNFHLPIASVTMTVAVTVAADSDADAVEKCFTDEIGRAVIEIADTGPGISPAIWQHGQSGSTIASRADKDVEAQALAGHEVRKRLLARLRRERIALAVREKVFLLPEKNPPPG